MRNRFTTIFAFAALTALFVSGCATAHPRHSDAKTAPADSQVTALQSELQAKDQQIQDLQYQLEQSRHTPEANYSSSSGKGTSSKIHVAGVSVSDLQNALNKAGFDAGSADGKMGKKTKSAIKAFQRAHGLKPDGVVGEKTWKLLQS